MSRSFGLRAGWAVLSAAIGAAALGLGVLIGLSALFNAFPVPPAVAVIITPARVAGVIRIDAILWAVDGAVIGMCLSLDR